jgi:hypothetical protein
MTREYDRMSHSRVREENLHVSDTFAGRLFCGIVSVSVTDPRQETAVGAGQDIHGGRRPVPLLHLFLGTWAGGLWITPFGSPWLGVYWMPFLVAGLFVALLVAATDQSSRRSYERKETEPDHVEHAALATAFGLLFWILIMALAIAIVAGYSAI